MLTRVINVAKTNLRRYSSALYITGDKAHNNFAVLTPHIDIVSRFEDRSVLEANVKARGKYIDLEGIANRWAFYQDLAEKRYIMEVTRSKVTKDIARLLKEEDNETNREHIVRLKALSTVLKDEYSTLKTFMYGVEESAALKALSLPNILHDRTPIDNPTILLEHLPKPVTQSMLEEFPSHIQIGNKQELLEVHDNSFAFLLNDAALYEQAVLNYFHEKLSQHGLVQFSNADFAKSIIVEGCGSDFNGKTDVITLENGGDHMINRLHLTGGASHYAFMAHFTKYAVASNQFPLRYFAIGRKYQPTVNDDQASLFNLVQQSAIEIFTASKSKSDMDQSLDDIVGVIGDIYKGLGHHFRLSIVQANQLNDYECLRVAIEMYSNHSDNYVEVGSISVLDEYLSKRLLFSYTDNKERLFPKLIVGNVLNVQKSLACVLENSYEDGRLKGIINDTLKQYVP